MRIRGVDLYEVRMPLVAAFETSRGRLHDRPAVLVRVRTDGAEGWGEVTAHPAPDYSEETTGTAWHILDRFLIPELLDKEIAAVGQATERLGRTRGNRMAKGGLVNACCDALARERGVSLAGLLGGIRETVRVGVSIGIQPSVDALVERVGAFLERGYRRVKIKIRPGWDVEPIERLLDSFPGIDLWADANGAYTLDEEDVVGRFVALAGAGLRLLEQPFPPEHWIPHRRLQEALAIPVALDESIREPGEAVLASTLPACRAINIKTGRVGGAEAAVFLADMASVSMAVFCGGMLETGIGRAANVAVAAQEAFTLPGDISASDRYYTEDLVDPPFALDADGNLPVPTGPGIGVTVREDLLRERTVRSASFGEGG